MPENKDKTTTIAPSPGREAGTLPPDLFSKDVYNGLTAFPKYLYSKYFYDERGDKLFQEIMHCPEYYLTNCEKEIFEKQSGELLHIILQYLSGFDAIELGAGDCYKSVHLYKAIQQHQLSFDLYPVDISPDVTGQLEKTLPPQLPGINITCLTGDYLQMLKKVNQRSSKPKLILFLGSSIGNMTIRESQLFFEQLRQQMSPGDLLLTGFDLKKHPRIILNAYNDSGGLTRDFNLNLLRRINNELEADFNPARFEHYPTYDPATGACKSYLVSLCRQTIHINKLQMTVPFEDSEYIFMERSQKYTLKQIADFARQSSFSLIRNFTDAKNWFADSLWVAGK